MKLQFTVELDTTTEDFHFEKEELQTYVDAVKWRSVLEEFSRWLRGQIKHGDKIEYMPVQEQLHSLLKDENLEL